MICFVIWTSVSEKKLPNNFNMEVETYQWELGG